MINIATCFSGIGAFEWAIKRMKIPHKIVFACDNGGIDISDKINYDDTFHYIKKLNKKQKAKEQKNIYKENSRKTNFIEKSYKANYEIKEEDFYYDIKLLDALDYKGEVDILVGGSPCQSFSLIGKQGGFEDTRGTLFFEFARILKECEAKVFIYENVKNLIYHDKGKTFQIIKNTFKELNYHIKYGVLNSKDFGIPQNRNRIFIIGFKEEKFCNKFLFPTPKLFSNLTMQDFLIDNCDEGCFTISKHNSSICIKKQKGDPFKIDSKAYLSDKLIKFVLSAPTKKFQGREKYNTINTEIAKTLISSQSHTKRAFLGNYVTTNNRLRSLCHREFLRLMGFTDEFNIVVSRTQSLEQSGNSIVVDVLIELFQKILDTNVFYNDIITTLKVAR
ncbi:DNA (cytosine-5-)-methyltransferase [Campylobacter sp. RM12651]|uniref:DNA cytosine methyltransferase n=1 Tax=Campylobacter sp. RM12651 TaxID=1660079 RepID=UPI001EFBBD55|nr:DNA (cytosine-5-)-methyltransferase [Campylobacter sp. RM12651]ULO03812.1 type IIS cytosine-specific DNA methyltransferase [Campylobacter sp. RM12651]